MVTLGLDPNNVTLIQLPGSKKPGPQKLVMEAGKKKSLCNSETELELLNVKVDHTNYYFDFGKGGLGMLDNVYGNMRYFYSPSHDIEITDQNVGISGGVAMVSDPKFMEANNCLYDDDDVGPYSLVSVHESIIESPHSSHHLTTVTIGERNSLQSANKKISCSKSFIIGNNGFRCSAAPTAPPRSREGVSSTRSSASQTEVTRPQMKHKQMQVSLDPPARRESPAKADRLPAHSPLHVTNPSPDSDRASTPSSAYSSAYTVTEHELAASEASTSYAVKDRFYVVSGNCSDPWSDESGLEHAWRRQRKSSKGAIGGRASGKGDACPAGGDFVVAFRGRRRKSLCSDGSSEEESSSLTGSVLSREQRDKEDEEMWVANEATLTCSLSDVASLQWLVPPPRVPPPLLPPLLLLPRLSVPPRLPQRRDRSVQRELCLSAVPPEPRVRVDVVAPSRGTMTALMPPNCDVTPQRNHFTNRQRIVESPSAPLKSCDKKDFSECSDPTWNKENQSVEGKGVNPLDLTSSSSSRPSKRFSFLVRSNSLRTEEGATPQPTKPPSSEPTPTPTPPTPPISASDKAILDRLSQLNLVQNPAAVSRPRLRPFPPQPPCGRCGDPVYPQELVRPTAELFFHQSCFKCQRCGLRLNLRNFFRNPSPVADTRVYCRTHLPSAENKPHCGDNVHANSSTEEKEIVKCDPVGLKYF